MNELTRVFDLRHLPSGPLKLIANQTECAALAERFALVSVQQIEAAVTLSADGPVVRAEGRLLAKLIQSCAVSGEDLAVRIEVPVTLRFVPAIAALPDDVEIELSTHDCDEIELDGDRFDLGEAIAQSLALAIDPFAAGPGAELARRRSGLLDEAASGPFAALAALKSPDRTN